MIAVEEVTPHNVGDALRDAAANQPGEGRPDSKSWGQSWAHRLVVSAKGPLRNAIREVLDEFLRSGRQQLVRLAANAYPERVGCGPAIADAVAGAESLNDPDTAEALYSALGRAIEAGQTDWRPAYRSLLRPDRRSPLLFGAFTGDRDWFAEHLDVVFGGTKGEAATAAWFLAESLGAEQRGDLRELVGAHRDELGAAKADKIIAQLDRA